MTLLFVFFLKIVEGLFEILSAPICPLSMSWPQGWETDNKLTTYIIKI